MTDIPVGKSGRSAQTVAVEVVREAGQVLLKHFRAIKHVREKSRGNIVTDVDPLVEDLIVKRLLAEFPGCGILAEESAPKAGDSPYTWVIDPLDGTRNYASGIPIYCVTIALAKGSELLVGATYDPTRSELFRAEQGKGAFLNDMPLHISAQTKLQACVVGSDLGYVDELGHHAFRMWDSLWPVSALRIMGSSALGLAYCAAARVDIFVHHFLYPWDMAAGVLFIQEAGGTVTNRDGRPIDFLKDPAIVASNGAVLQDFLQRTEGLEWRKGKGKGTALHP